MNEIYSNGIRVWSDKGVHLCPERTLKELTDLVRWGAITPETFRVLHKKGDSISQWVKYLSGIQQYRQVGFNGALAKTIHSMHFMASCDRVEDYKSKKSNQE